MLGSADAILSKGLANLRVFSLGDRGKLDPFGDETAGGLDGLEFGLDEEQVAGLLDDFESWGGQIGTGERLSSAGLKVETVPVPPFLALTGDSRCFLRVVNVEEETPPKRIRVLVGLEPPV